MFPWAIGNHHIWSKVREHVASASDEGAKLSSKSCIFVLGASGIGKTYHIQKILEEYEVYRMDASNCGNHKEFRDMLTKGCNPYLVTRTNCEKDFVVLIDDMDILCSMDRTIMTALFDVLANKSSSPLAHVPIVVIGSLDIERKVVNAKGKCTVLRCTAPTDTEVFMFLKAHPQGSKKTKKLLMQIAEDCHGNLNRALQAIASIPNKKTGTYICSTEQQRTKAARVSEIQQHMADDPWMTPLRYHENLPKWLVNGKEKMQTYRSILPYFSMWDQMMHHSEIESELAVDVLAHALCIHTPSLDTSSLPALEDFTKILSNLSLQKKHERSMFPSWDHGFPWPHAQIFCEYIKKQKWIT